MPQHNEITVVLKLDADTPYRLKDKEKMLKTISDLPADDQQRILELASNPKALDKLKSNWQMLKSFIS